MGFGRRNAMNGWAEWIRMGRSKLFLSQIVLSASISSLHPDPRKRDNEGRNWRKPFYCCHLKIALIYWCSGSPVWGLGGPSEMAKLGSGKLFSMGPFVSSWERSAILELQGLWCIMENRGFNSTQKKDSGKWASETGTSAFPQQHRCSPPRPGDIGNIWSWTGAWWVPFGAEKTVHEVCEIT